VTGRQVDWLMPSVRVCIFDPVRQCLVGWTCSLGRGPGVVTLDPFCEVLFGHQRE